LQLGGAESRHDGNVAKSSATARSGIGRPPNANPHPPRPPNPQHLGRSLAPATTARATAAHSTVAATVAAATEVAVLAGPVFTPPPPLAATAIAAAAALASTPEAAAPVGHHARDARAQLLRTDALRCLGSSAQQPVVDKAKIPSSWSEILLEWQRSSFESYRHLSMKKWRNKEHKGRYIKRKTAMEEIERFAFAHNQSLEEGAEFLDRQKRNN
jgi:hypothetical protein